MLARLAGLSCPAPSRWRRRRAGLARTDPRLRAGHRRALGIANPYAAILSAAMPLRHSLGLHAEARGGRAWCRRRWTAAA